MNALKIYRLSNYFYKKNLKLLSKILDGVNYLLHNSYIPGSCTIGKDTKIAYGGIGVVIHARAIIGENCLIGQGITIGGRNGLKEVPVIENNVYLGAGCRILGNVKIASNNIIAPNSIVTKNIEMSYTIWGGVPSKVISYITNENYYKYKDYGIKM